MRLFIALTFDELAPYLKELQQQLPEAKASYPKHFHLTLKFLGEVADDKIEAIKEKLSTVSFSPLTFKLGKIGAFPNERQIRVVWVGLDDHNAVQELQQQIDDVLAGMFDRDKRFHPHLTLARIKQPPEDKAQFAQDLKKIPVAPQEITLTHFELMKSTLTSEGPVYEVVAQYQ